MTTAQRLARQRAEDRRAGVFRRATSRFRPRKSDRGRLVFLRAADARRGKAGQRVPAGFRGRVFVAWVGPRGGVRWVKEKDGIRIPKPVSIRTLDPGRIIGTRKVKQAVKADVQVRFSKRVPPITVVKDRGSVDWFDDFEPKLMKQMMKAIRLEHERFDFNVEVSAIVRFPDGSVKSLRSMQSPDFSAEALFQISGKQANNPEAMIRTFIRRKLYADFAEQVQQEGFVTRGSAMFVKKLKVNRGKDRSEWRGSDGYLWRKRELEEVGLKRIDAQILKRNFVGKD